MIAISVNHIAKSFQVGENVLKDLSFSISEGEHVGILGKNGAGKTTLFRLITGQYLPDDGQIHVAPGLRVGLISQIPVYPETYRVEEVLDTAFSRIHTMENELRELAERMAAGECGEEIMRRYDQLSARYELANGYSLDIRLNKVCNGLGISTEFRKRFFSELSGGEKTRINLARLILEDTDILLLDEPTNHLDLHATQWLEEYVSHFKGTVLVVSHDRYFLDQCVSRIIALNEGIAEFYSGNYSFYVKERERRYQERLRQYEKERAKIEQLTQAAEQMHLWAFMGNDKLHKRAFSMEKRIEKLHTTDRPRQEKNMTIQFRSADFKGDVLFKGEQITKFFGDHRLFSDVNLEMLGGERIALLGDNGTGKTTLLKILLKEEIPDAGDIRYGPTVRIGYLPQIVTFEHRERSLLDTMLYEKKCSAQEARDCLAAFRFRGEDVYKSVTALSGGELSRLKLCMLMMDPINLLILDEPTNHLDVNSREWIEDAVEHFDGALLFVSHDRYFIHRFAERIWTLDDGKITDFRGDYDAFLDKQERERELREIRKPVPEKRQKREKHVNTGGTKLLEKKIHTLEREIAKLEDQNAVLLNEMEINACNYQKLQELTDIHARIEAELNSRYDEWEKLSVELELQK